MAKKVKKTAKRVAVKKAHLGTEENFRFALNAAVLAVMIAVLLAMVGQIGDPTSWFSKALMP
jgi:hypothetical protein